LKSFGGEVSKLDFTLSLLHDTAYKIL